MHRGGDTCIVPTLARNHYRKGLLKPPASGDQCQLACMIEVNGPGSRWVTGEHLVDDWRKQHSRRIGGKMRLRLPCASMEYRIA